MLPLLSGAAVAGLVLIVALAVAQPGRLFTFLADPLAATPLLAGFGAGAASVAILAVVLLEIRIRGLVKATERIAAGELDVQIDVPRSGLERRLGTSINAISIAMAETYDRATIDKLTGVANRQSLITALWTEVERAGRYGRAISVAFIDIDHFKNVNDTYGHASGDLVLRGVAQAIKANLRASDLVGRYGGEEFMLVLTETDVEEASILAEKLRTLVEKLTFEVEGNAALSVTVSIGIAGGSGPTLRFEALVRDADGAMYSAKSLGRNQTYIFAEPNEDARVPRAPLTPAGRLRAQELGRIARDAAQSAIASVLASLPEYGGRPSALIASIVVGMAGQLELPDVEMERLRVAALLHDVGKIGVPAEILDKATPLTAAEWRTVVQHARIGQVVLEQASLLREAAPIILHHHERFSGHGYPFGLRGSAIPLGARLIAIADAYDAMTHARPHKRAVSHDQAVKELQRHSGTQFDPALVKLFVELYGDAAPALDATVLELIAGIPRPAQLVQISAGPGGAGSSRAPKATPRRRRRATVDGSAVGGASVQSVGPDAAAS